MVELGRFRPAWRGERIAGRVVDGELKPYATRADIEAGALDRLNLAFLWVDDPVEAFFLEIQGSGQVRLGDGSVVRVTYDGQNGRPYVPIGRLLMERGALAKEDVSMQIEFAAGSRPILGMPRRSWMRTRLMCSSASWRRMGPSAAAACD